MITPILGSVWIDYRNAPEMPCNWSIYDADTGRQFNDVTALQITVVCDESPVVDLRRVNTMGTERYYLVGRPERVQIPTEMTPGVTLNVPRGYAVPVCAECSGSGYYVSPVTGKRSPCSAGCKP